MSNILLQFRLSRSTSQQMAQSFMIPVSIHQAVSWSHSWLIATLADWSALPIVRSQFLSSPRDVKVKWYEVRRRRRLVPPCQHWNTSTASCVLCLIALQTLSMLHLMGRMDIYWLHRCQSWLRALQNKPPNKQCNMEKIVIYTAWNVSFLSKRCFWFSLMSHQRPMLAIGQYLSSVCDKSAPWNAGELQIVSKLYKKCCIY